MTVKGGEKGVVVAAKEDQGLEETRVWLQRERLDRPPPQLLATATTTGPTASLACACAFPYKYDSSLAYS